MDQRDWRAPIALARNAPVAQTPHDLFVAEVFGFEIGGYRIDRLPVLKAVVFARIDTDAVFLVGIRFLPGIGAEGFAFDCDDLRNRQPVNLGEMKIPLIVRRHAHHCAVAVAHQHVVADPDLDLGTGQRMIDVDAGGHTFLFHRRHVGLDDATVFAFVNEGGELRIVFRCLGGERMFGGHRAEGHAHDGVGARGEDPEFVGKCRVAGGGPLDRKGKAHTVALADPVRLHGLHALGPTRQGVERAKEFIGVFRDRHVIHRDLALFDQRAGAPAATVDHLFVGEYRLINRVPVDGAGFFIDQTFFQHAQEQPLVPAVVIGFAGGQLAFPVDCKAERLQLLFHVRDVVVGPLRRRHAVGHRRVFRRQAEGVPAHRLHYVITTHAVITGQRIAYGIVSHVPHMQFPRGVREHRQTVIFALARYFNGAE